jgi:hypothetical protein
MIIEGEHCPDGEGGLRYICKTSRGVVTLSREKKRRMIYSSFSRYIYIVTIVTTGKMCIFFRPMKMEFPWFHGEDPIIWLHRVTKCWVVPPTWGPPQTNETVAVTPVSVGTCDQRRRKMNRKKKERQADISVWETEREAVSFKRGSSKQREEGEKWSFSHSYFRLRLKGHLWSDLD